MIVPKRIVHQIQRSSYNCGAASIAMLLNRSQEECEKICQTKKSGTCCYNVLRGLKLLKIPCFLVFLDVDFIAHLQYLEAISYKFPLYVGGTYKDKNLNGRGRDYIRQHAIAIADGMVYDPAALEPFPIVAYAHKFSRSLTIKTLIIIDAERPDFSFR